MFLLFWVTQVFLWHHHLHAMKSLVSRLVQQLLSPSPTYFFKQRQKTVCTILVIGRTEFYWPGFDRYSRFAMVVTRTCGAQVRVAVNRRCSTDRSTRTTRRWGASSSGGNNGSYSSTSNNMIAISICVECIVNPSFSKLNRNIDSASVVWVAVWKSWRQEEVYVESCWQFVWRGQS